MRTFYSQIQISHSNYKQQGSPPHRRVAATCIWSDLAHLYPIVLKNGKMEQIYLLSFIFICIIIAPRIPSQGQGSIVVGTVWRQSKRQSLTQSIYSLRLWSCKLLHVVGPCTHAQNIFLRQNTRYQFRQHVSDPDLCRWIIVSWMLKCPGFGKSVLQTQFINKAQPLLLLK